MSVKIWTSQNLDRVKKILGNHTNIHDALPEISKTVKMQCTYDSVKTAFRDNANGGGLTQFLKQPTIEVKPKIILIDIETGPNVSYTWGKWDQNVIAFKQEWQLLSFAYKELGKSKISCISRPDFKDATDLSITKAIWEVLNKADIIIAHNGDKFDVPKLRAKFVEHSLAPPTPFKTIDTLKIAKGQFNFNSNSLNDLAFTLKIGRKKHTGGFDLWLACIDGDSAAWRKMIAYNKHDVILLEKVYERLKSWYPSHPNLALFIDRPGCPVCASANVQRQGFNVMKVRKNARFQCKDCGNWFAQALPKAKQ